MYFCYVVFQLIRILALQLRHGVDLNYTSDLYIWIFQKAFTNAWGFQNVCVQWQLSWVLGFTEIGMTKRHYYMLNIKSAPIFGHVKQLT